MCALAADENPSRNTPLDSSHPPQKGEIIGTEQTASITACAFLREKLLLNGLVRNRPVKPFDLVTEIRVVGSNEKVTEHLRRCAL